MSEEPRCTTTVPPLRVRVGRPVRIRVALALLAVVAGWATYAIATSGALSWTRVEVPVAADLRAVAFSSALDGHAVGDGGTILATHDGGVTWTRIDNDATATLNAVEVLPSGSAWAVGQGGLIQASADGTSWSTRASGIATDLLGVDFPDAEHGWSVGRGATILATADGGSTWTAQSAGVPTATVLTGIAFVDQAHGWAWGGAGTVLRTTDGGSTWTTATAMPAGVALRAGSFVDDRTGWIAGDEGVVMKTTDGGSTWTSQALESTAAITGIAFVDAENGFLIGGDGASTAGFVASTTDGGSTWVTRPTGTTAALRGVRFADIDHGWIVGDAGTVLRGAPGASAAESALPAAPTAVHARVMRAGEVLVGWSEVTTGTTAPVSYRISRSVAGGEYVTLTTVSALVAPGFTDKTAPHLADVSYAVSTIDARGESAPSVPATVTTPAPPAPVEPRPEGMSCLGCHSVHEAPVAPAYTASPDGACLACHADDIGERLTGVDPGTRHDLLTADQASSGSRMACANCHHPHVSSEATPIVDPDDPGPAGGLPSATDSFCLKCHDSELPTSAQTSRWARSPLAAGGATVAADIAASWPASIHGGGNSTAPHLRAGMGYAQGDVLACATCHDAHGSTNRWTLRESLPSRDSTSQAQALLVLPLAGGGADLRLFCAGCHSLASHPAADLSQWPLDCTPCHSHGTAGL